MHLLFLNNEYPPLGGGTGTVNERLIHFIGKNRPDLYVTQITSTDQPKLREECPYPNIRIIRLPLPWRNIHHADLNVLVRYLFTAYFEAVHQHKNKPFDRTLAWAGLPAGLTAYMLSKRCGIPYSVRISGPEVAGFEKRYNLIYPLLKPILRVVFNSARAVIIKSSFERELLKKSFNNLANLVTVSNGIELPPESLARPVHDPSKPLKVLCVARLVERKGQDQLIKALALLKAKGVIMTLRLVGDGDWSTELKRLAQSLNVSPQIEFTGYIAREQMPLTYATSDLFALASSAEGMSIATLEALSFGLPCIVPYGRGFDELCDDETGPRFAWGDTEALATALMNCSDAKSLQRYGRAARERAENFSWATQAAELMRVVTV